MNRDDYLTWSSAFSVNKSLEDEHPGQQDALDIRKGEFGEIDYYSTIFTTEAPAIEALRSPSRLEKETRSVGTATKIPMTSKSCGRMSPLLRPLPFCGGPSLVGVRKRSQAISRKSSEDDSFFRWLDKNCTVERTLPQNLSREKLSCGKHKIEPSNDPVLSTVTEGPERIYSFGDEETPGQKRQKIGSSDCFDRIRFPLNLAHERLLPSSNNRFSSGTPQIASGNAQSLLGDHDRWSLFALRRLETNVASLDINPGVGDLSHGNAEPTTNALYGDDDDRLGDRPSSSFEPENFQYLFNFLQNKKATAKAATTVTDGAIRHF